MINLSESEKLILSTINTAPEKRLYIWTLLDPISSDPEIIGINEDDIICLLGEGYIRKREIHTNSIEYTITRKGLAALE